MKAPTECCPHKIEEVCEGLVALFEARGHTVATALAQVRAELEAGAGDGHDRADLLVMRDWLSIVWSNTRAIGRAA